MMLIAGIMNLKFAYEETDSILQRNINGLFLRESIMTAAIKSISFIAAAVAAVSSFSQELYVAHGGYAPAVRG